MAQDLEVLVEGNKYEARISMLEGYVNQLQNLLDEYGVMRDRVTEIFGDNSDQLAAAQQNVTARMKRVENAIAATQTNIDTLQKTLANMENLGENVSRILEEGIAAASAGLFD